MDLVLNVAIVIFLYMTIVFLLAQIKKDNSIVDIFWGLGFILIAVYSMILSDHVTVHKWIMNTMILLWGGRLSFHILLRNWGKPEDFRYKAWRDSWKFFVLRSYFQIFMLQGLFMLIIAAPVYFINFYSPGKFHVTDYIGIILFLIGFYFEVAGDLQLNRFKRNPENKGRIITTGLWSITRHPNYFGEALLWWGIGFMALSGDHGWLTLIGPVVITLLLRFVSGVPMLEKKYNGRSDWENYKNKTAPFVPFIRFL